MMEILNKLSPARGAGIRVAIVDSGVETSHPWVGGRVCESYKLNKGEDGYDVVPCKSTDLIGHGTAVAGGIRRFAPDVDLISVQVLGAGLRADSEGLVAALRWLVDQDVNVVNLSLSTMRVQLALRIGHAIDDLSAKNVSCVCARGYHLNGRAYPTDFASTVAVSYRKLPLAKLEFRPNDSVEFDASGIDIEVAWKTKGKNLGTTQIVQGSSYSCPLVTGLVSRMLSVDPDLTPYEVKSLLKAYAERQADGWWEPWMDEVASAPVCPELITAAK